MSTPQDKAAAVAAHTYVSSRKENVLRTRVVTSLNDFVHLPIVEDLCYTGYWLFHCLLGPIYGVGLLLLLLKDALVGALVPTLEEAKGRSILVTGCDTGFGYELALELYTRGWNVYAGCLRAESVATLREKAGGSSMHALLMDVTKQVDIDRVVQHIEKENPQQGLYAVVLNAGVGRGGVVDWMPLEEYRSIMEVNFFSVVAVVKTCLPLLKQAKGRIVNVTSFAGLFHGAPCMSAYCASKHASEAFTTSLRLEMKGWGIKVVTVNPSFHKTHIASGAVATLQQSYDALPPAKQAEYGPSYLKTCRSICNRAHKSSWDPHNVVTALLRASTAVRPRTQYIVGSDAKFALLPLLNLPTHLVEDMISYVLLRRLVPAKVRDEEQKGKAGVAVVEQKEEKQTKRVSAA